MKTSLSGRLLAVLACLLVIASACSGEERNEPAAAPSAPGRDTPVELEETPNTVPPQFSPTPAAPVFENPEQVLRVAIGEPSTLDPMRISDPGSLLVARQLYEGLTKWDQASQTVQPAASTWKVTNGGKAFTFELREGLTFHDGRPVTAEDFRFAFNRIALKKNGSDLAYLLEHVKGFDQVNALGDKKQLSGIQAPKKDRLVITLSEPYQNFPAVLTHPSLVPLQEKAVEKLGRFLREPVGNGPFEMAKPFEIGRPIVLEAYDDWPEPPSIEGIRFLPYPKVEASWIPFQEGSLDVAEVPTSRIEAAEEEYGDRGFQPLLVGSYYGFNIDSKQLKLRSKRVAINRAIDRESIAGDIFEQTLAPPRGIVPDGMPGFRSDECGTLCDHSPEVAEGLVRKLPKKSRAVTLEYTEEPTQKKVAKAIRDDLEDVGLKVETKAYEFPKYLRLLRAGDQSMYRLGWVAEYPDPDVFLFSLFSSASPDNHSGFSSNAVDKRLLKARAEVVDKKRTKLYRRAEELILKHAPIAPLGSFVMHWAAQPDVEGIRFDVLGGFDAADVSLNRS
jgi:peptide/nickel transport system substrate-binding protein/oligopeptide transport system substrate-binding protein